MESINVKSCVRCKKTKNIIDFTKGNNILKTCLRCRDMKKKNVIKNKCEHNKIKNVCRNCNGHLICIHNKIRYSCIICDPLSFCLHKRRKSICKDCNGKSICEHKKLRNVCRDCNGKSICEHNRVRINCKECSKNPLKLLIQKMIYNSKGSDKLHNRYDQTNFIDKCFVKNLIEDSNYICCYCSCKLQIIYNKDNLMSIERIDNSIGHIKGNVKISCFRCNYTKVGNKINF